MFIKKTGKKAIGFILTVCLMFTAFSSVSSAASVSSDVSGHWAESQISDWTARGLIKGYEDGTFKPDNTITRAEFIALINRSFEFSEEATITFSDVASSNWAYTEVAKAVKAGYITGYEDGTFGTNKLISRQETAVIVARLLNLSATGSIGAPFHDASLIASWAKDAVDMAVASKILKGYAADNTFKPTNPITRAEAVVTLDRASSSKVLAYDKAGTYGPTTGIEIINRDVVINVADVTLQNMVINGKLTFAAGIGSGDAFLNNVTVNGETVVQGGGVNSIHFKNSVLQTVTVDKKDGPVRIVAEGTTTVAQVNVNSSATIQETAVTGAGFGNVTLTNALPEGSNITLKGTFDNLEVVGSKINVDIPEGSVQKVTAETTAAGMKLNLGKDAKIVSLILNAAAQLTGTGTIDSATLSVNAKAGSTFQTAPTKTIDAVTATPAPTATATPNATPAPTGTTGTPTSETTTPTPSVPSAPTNLSITNGSTQISLAWSPVTGAAYYNVYQSENSSPYHLISTPTAVTAAVYNVTGLLNGTHYFFKISAKNTVGESTYSNVVSATPGATVNLGMAGNYVILAKSGISTATSSTITGDIGVSPIAATAITGFNLIADSSNQFSKSSQVTGSVYAADYTSPTLSILTTAVNDMLTAYTDTAGRAANYNELFSGDITGKTLAPGVYKWSTGVSINSGIVTLDGGANDVWIFQIAGGITQASATRINLTGGAQAKNVFWQAADTVAIGTGAHFEGTILAMTNISLGTNASINGRLLASTAVTLDSSTVVVAQ
jgi:molybdopterin-binding protein